MLKECIHDEVMTFELENEIHIMEMERHLESNGYHEHEKNKKRNEWIDENGKGMRDYLESMKYIIRSYGNDLQHYGIYCQVVEEYNKRFEE
jgi:hypothetical protein